MQKLEVLYIGNNMIAKIDELNNLVSFYQKYFLIKNEFLFFLFNLNRLH